MNTIDLKAASKKNQNSSDPAPGTQMECIKRHNLIQIYTSLLLMLVVEVGLIEVLGSMSLALLWMIKIDLGLGPSYSKK